jgi:hypothetical protein
LAGVFGHFVLENAAVIGVLFFLTSPRISATNRLALCEHSANIIGRPKSLIVSLLSPHKKIAEDALELRPANLPVAIAS